MISVIIICIEERSSMTCIHLAGRNDVTYDQVYSA
jgi:hypothetical protein